MTARFPIGTAIFPPTAQKVINSIKLAEEMDVPMIWVPSWPIGPDGFHIVTAAATQTSNIGLATGITISYPRHPLTVANEALVMAELAPQRFRLGIGASHKTAIEGIYGLDFAKPIGHLREYITILRNFLWEGHVDFSGEYYNVHAELPPMIEPPRIPIVLAAVRRNMLRLAGEVSDGALAIWSPLPYIQNVALPALEEGARNVNRPRPRMIANFTIMLEHDFGVVRQHAQAAFDVYRNFPTYAKLFQEAGFPLKSDGQLSDELIHELYFYGDEDTIRARLYAMYEGGVDELLVAISPVNDPVQEQKRLFEIIASINKA